MIRLVFLVLVFLSSNAFGQEYLTTTGEVTFLSKAPLNEFEGKSGSLNGLINLEKNLLDFYVDLNTLKTGIKLRDSHMRENYLETEKHPFAEFTGEIENLPTLKIDQKTPVTAKGKFKIHGVEQVIEVLGSLTLKNNGKIELVAGFIILLSDYKIDRPKLVFYELAEEQKVSIQATLTQKK